MGSCIGQDTSRDTLRKLNDPSLACDGIFATTQVQSAERGEEAKEEAKEERREEKKENMVIEIDKADTILDMTPSGQWPMPGESVVDIRFDFAADLAAVKAKFAKKFTDLLNQEFVPVPSGDESKGQDPQSAPFSVMQLNMLSDALSTGYEMQDDKKKTFVGVDKDCLRWTYRGLRLVELIYACDCDIIFLEECDTAEYLGKYLSARGYEWLHQPKSKSPTRHVAKSLVEERGLRPDFALPRDGVFVAFKTERFELVSEQRIDDKENPVQVVGLAVTLRDKVCDREFVAVTTHLKSTKSQDGESIRVGQMRMLQELIANEKQLPMIWGCDLNANPVVNRNGYHPECYNALTSEFGFESVYVIGNGSEPEYTTWKYRETGTDRHTIDYIFLKNSQWSVTHLLSIPKGDEDSKALIPNWHYPSDHFVIACTLQWNAMTQ